MAGPNSYRIGVPSDYGNRLRLHFNSNAYIDFYPNMYFRSYSASPTYYPLTLKDGGKVGINNINPVCALDINGEVRVNGIVVHSSDKRLKENINNLNGTLDSVLMLQGVTYKIKRNKLNVIKNKELNAAYDENADPMDTVTQIPVADVAIFEKEQIGFIAQDVQKLYPNLVYTDSAGMLSINYIGIIPLLTQALKELNQKNEIQSNDIESLKKELESIKKKLNNGNYQKSAEASTGWENSFIENTSYLEQNMPNPFNRNTVIRYYIHTNNVKCMICIYDLNGCQLKCYHINAGGGNGSIALNANELKPGMFIYSLIVNGKIEDSKRMVITE